MSRTFWSGEPPLVSICIPAFNAARFVGNAIRSARSQSYPALEIVVLDNASTDETPSAIEDAVDSDPRVRFIRHSHNLGMAGNFNAALDAAHGELLLILCADDVIDSDCIGILAEGLKNEPGCVLAACGRKLIDESSRVHRIKRTRATRTRVSGIEVMVECFVRNNVVGEPSAVMFRRNAATPRFSEVYCQLLDLDMWFRLLSHGDALFIPEAHCSIRTHDEQWSKANVRSGRVLADKQRFFRQYVDTVRPYLSPSRKLLWDARMASSVVRLDRASPGVSNVRPRELFYPSLFSFLRGCVHVAYRSSALARHGLG